MRTLSSTIKNQIINELIDNEIYINFPNDYIDSIMEKNIVAESMTLKQSVCDESSLKLGGCISSQFEIQVMDDEEYTFDESITGKFITVYIEQTYASGDYVYPSSSLYPSNGLYPGEEISSTNWLIFAGCIDSFTRDKTNPHIFKLVAYDPLTKSFEKDISSAVRKKMKNDTATILSLLPLCLSSDLFTYNDFTYDMNLAQTELRNRMFEKSQDKLSKGELLRYLSELVGGYAYYRPQDAKFRVMGKSVGNSLSGTEIYNFYENLTKEDKRAKEPKGILFNYGGDIEDYNNDQNHQNTSAAYYGLYLVNDTEGDYRFVEIDENFNETYYNYYDITDNILIWDYSSRIAPTHGFHNITTLYQAIKPKIIAESNYVPLTATLDCRLWVEPGDTIQIKVPSTNVYGEYLDANGDVVDDVEDAEIKTITSRVFSRKITGIKAMTDEIEAKGVI